LPLLIGMRQLNMLKKFLASLALILLILSNAFAQTNSPLKLTLQEAVQIALQANPQVQIGNLNVAQAEQDRSIARSQLLPQVDLSVSVAAERFNVDTFFGKHENPQAIGPFEVFQAGPSFSTPIFDLSLWRRYQASLYGVKAGQSQAEVIREQTVLLVVSQYLACLRAGANVQAAQSRVDLAAALHKLASDRQDSGAGTGLDTLRANVQLQNEKQQLIVAQTDLKTGLLSLSRLLNANPLQPIELTDQVRFFETPSNNIGQSLENAYTNRAEMKALSASELRVQKDRNAISAQRLPSITAQGEWGYNGLGISSAIPVYQVAIGINIPVFTGGRIKAEVAKADIEIKKIEQQKQDLGNQIAQQVLTAAAQLDAARNEVEVANQGVKLATEEVSQSRDRFQAGVANNIEVITAQDELARANDNQINALYRFNQARADLAHATGQVEAIYSK
jgi:outer membrane protein TolC